MDMILISDTKLKVMLSPLDMEELALSNNDIDYNNTETRRAFWSILDEAKHKTGFDAARTRVFIQVYPSKSGGCELYVTKLASRSHGNTDNRRHISCRVKRTDTENAVIDRDPDCAVYRFDTLELMLTAANKLFGMDFDGSSSAYTDGERYYLAISSDEADCSDYRCTRNAAEKYAFIGEYGTSLDRDILKLYINEHCKCICASDAVKILSSVS